MPATSRDNRRPRDSCKHLGITGTNIPMRRYMERGHNSIHGALSTCRSAPKVLPHQPPACKADLLRMLVALTHLRQLPSLQLHGELAARAGAGSFVPWPQLCCQAHFFQQHHRLSCHIMSGWSPILLYKRLLYACSSSSLVPSICVSFTPPPASTALVPVTQSCCTLCCHWHICSSCPQASPKLPPTVMHLNPAVCGHSR